MTFTASAVRFIKKTPEVLPLFGIIGVVSVFGITSATRKIMHDQDLRIRPNHGNITWEERLDSFAKHS
ncbi:hypothetical protein BKA69DRAFT_1079863 [Paraphysoderma sedebokerense]|nr:hypothetical protein BKA69DRAFT_1079863 [Paraphysoderma sedebokerense]